MRTRRLCLPVLLLLLLPLRAGHGAGPAEERLDLNYHMYFGGFHVAEVGFEQWRDGRAYEADLSIRTTGLADLIARYRGRAVASGIDDEARRAQPERYTYRYSSRKSRREVEVTYDPATGDAREVVSRKRGKDDPSDVPRDLWQGVIDPLSAILALREQIRAGRAGGAGAGRGTAARSVPGRPARPSAVRAAGAGRRAERHGPGDVGPVLRAGARGVAVPQGGDQDQDADRR